MRDSFFPRAFQIVQILLPLKVMGLFLQWEQDWASHNALANSTSSILNWECAFTIIMSQNGCKIQLYWSSADGLLRHLLELWLISFFFFSFPMAYVPKHPTTQKSSVCSESLMQFYMQKWATGIVIISALCCEEMLTYARSTSLKLSFWEGKERNA